MTKLQRMYLQDPRQVTSTHDKVTTQSMYLQDPRQVAVHVTKLQHTACTYALSIIRSITIIVDVVSFILDTTYIGD